MKKWSEMSYEDKGRYNAARMQERREQGVLGKYLAGMTPEMRKLAHDNDRRYNGGRS
jgi:hypothetical protein